MSRMPHLGPGFVHALGKADAGQQAPSVPKTIGEAAAEGWTGFRALCAGHVAFPTWQALSLDPATSTIDAASRLRCRRCGNKPWAIYLERPRRGDDSGWYDNTLLVMLSD
jgi:hypothetical protein